MKNKLAHCLNGNTARSWKQQHKANSRVQLTIGTLNPSGLSDVSKQQAIHELDLDVMAITETHLGDHMHRAYDEQYPQYSCNFSLDPKEKTFSGVALFLKHSCFWQVQNIQWPTDSQCFKFANEGRLVAVQAWYGHGGNSILFYCAYAPSGSRWEKPKRAALHQLLDAVIDDTVARGQLPTVLLGDLNMPIHESFKMQQILKDQVFMDLRNIADPSMKQAATCYHGPNGGSCIDYILSTPGLYDSFSHFEIRKIEPCKDHGLVSVKLSVPAPVQTRLCLKKPTALPNLQRPCARQAPLKCQIDGAFKQKLQLGQIDEAYNLLTHEINRLLHEIAKIQGHDVYNNGVRKGQIKFQSQRRHPKAIGAHASTMYSRKIYRAINQAKEVLRASPGYRRDQTWAAIPKTLYLLPADQFATLNVILSRPASNDDAQQIVDSLTQILEHTMRQDRQQRILKWKQKMRSDEAQQYHWLKNKSKRKPIAITVVTGQPTANTHARLDAISQVWKKIYSIHKKGEPSAHTFFQKYGEHMKRSISNLPPIHAQQIIATLKKIRPSSPGMDHIAPLDLQILAEWAPDLFSHFAELYNCIESTGKWPTLLPMGAVSFLPKTDDPSPSAQDFRPLTILSAVYRLYATIRHNDLCAHWLPKWKSTSVYGLKQSNAADALAFQTCLEMMEYSKENYLTAGISYDMKKCFDSIPKDLILAAFNFRGADCKVTKALSGFYRQHTKHFRIDGAYDASFQPANGIVQGCPLSMLLLTSLICTWNEYCVVQSIPATPRSYADDLSICTRARTKQDLIAGTQKAHEITSEFVKFSGMQLNERKCFTFGHKAVSACLPQIDSHKSQFRLVGASIKLDKKPMWTALERERRSNWQSTVENIAKLPIGWFGKVKILKSTMGKLTFGQGTHTLSLAKDDKRSLRASVIRCLLNQLFYDSSPTIIFTLLAPPSVDPEFSMHLAAFSLLRRLYPTTTSRTQLCHQVTAYDQYNEMDGPITRIRQMLDHPAFKQTIHKFLNNQLEEHKWQHDLREDYRQVGWKTLAVDRGQHFRGIERGVQRELTTSLIDILAEQAEHLQQRIDNNLVVQVDPKTDPRPRLKILRQLMSAGLQTPERDHRHRKQSGTVTCACGNGSPTIFHLSWECPLSQQLREPMMKALPAPLHELPTCFQIATIVPHDMTISKVNLHIVQNTLISIWQKHIEEWYGKDEDTPQATVTHITEPHLEPTQFENPSAPISAVHQAPKRGHILKLIPTGGVFCCRCGLQTKIIQHQRLKILSKACAFPDLPESDWLTSPGAVNSNPRILAAEKQLQEKHNRGGHFFVWNRLVGKEKGTASFGMIWCTRCGRQWPWKDRGNNMSRTTCMPSNTPPSPPDWVLNLSHYQRSSSSSNANISNERSNAIPMRRIRGKQTISSNLQTSPVSRNSPGTASSSSGIQHRHGIG